MTDEQERSPLASFLRQDRAFWTDVYKNVLTFSITGILALLVAVAAGFVSQPEVSRVLRVIGYLIVGLVVTHLLINVLGQHIERNHGHAWYERYINGMMLTVIAGGSVALVLSFVLD